MAGLLAMSAFSISTIKSTLVIMTKISLISHCHDACVKHIVIIAQKQRYSEL